METSEIVDEITSRRQEMTVGLLKIYNYYRVFVGLALLLTATQTTFTTHLGSLNPTLFTLVATIYTGVNLASALIVQMLPSRLFHGQFINFCLVLFDIVCLTLLMYYSGGVSSGLGALILISVATGAIVCAGQVSTLIAALATIALLYEEFYLSLTPGEAADFFQAGILGGLYFAFSLVIQFLSNRLRQNDLRALTQAAELADLERVNRQIIQRMRTGIILVDANDHMRMANHAARALLGQIQDETIAELPNTLTKRLRDWREDTNLRTPPFQAAAGTPEIRVNFAPVRENDPQGDVTVFIEDTGEVQQQAQRLKLASLGRLSASIAHEIRNPLGAISHAAQLLSESDQLDKGDARLTDIIHSHCQRMNGVIENVLELSRRTPPAPVKLLLADYLAEFMEAFTEAVPDAEFEFDVTPTDTEVRIDESQVNQVLTNLCQNAARYSQETTGIAYIGLFGGIDDRTDRPFLDVIDRGPGVPAEQLKNLFEPFFTTESAGTGLGLYISKEICEANQAQLNYIPLEDGSCFRVTFAHPERITG